MSVRRMDRAVKDARRSALKSRAEHSVVIRPSRRQALVITTHNKFAAEGVAGCKLAAEKSRPLKAVRVVGVGNEIHIRECVYYRRVRGRKCAERIRTCI